MVIEREWSEGNNQEENNDKEWVYEPPEKGKV